MQRQSSWPLALPKCSWARLWTVLCSWFCCHQCLGLMTVKSKFILLDPVFPRLSMEVEIHEAFIFLIYILGQNNSSLHTSSSNIWSDQRFLTLNEPQTWAWSSGSSGSSADSVRSAHRRSLDFLSSTNYSRSAEASASGVCVGRCHGNTREHP